MKKSFQWVYSRGIEFSKLKSIPKIDVLACLSPDPVPEIHNLMWKSFNLAHSFWRLSLYGQLGSRQKQHGQHAMGMADQTCLVHSIQEAKQKNITRKESGKDHTNIVSKSIPP